MIINFIISWSSVRFDSIPPSTLAFEEKEAYVGVMLLLAHLEHIFFLSLSSYLDLEILKLVLAVKVSL